jgi:O-antigen/teichoic acid export membrane protein
MSNKYKRLAGNSTLIIIGGVLAKAISFFMLPFYTKWLTPSDYGISDCAGVYSTLLLGLVTFCVAEAMFLFPKVAKEEKKKTYFSSGLFYSIILLALTAVIFELISLYAQHQNIHNIFCDYIWYIYLMIVSTFIQTFTQQFACAIDKMKVYSLTGVVYAVVLVLLSFLMVEKYKVVGYVLSMTFAGFVASIYTILASKSYNYYTQSSVDIKAYFEITKYSIPLIPNSIMWWFVSSINRPIMESSLGAGAIGIYAVAFKFPSILTILFGFFVTSWQVSLIEEYRSNEFESFYNNILKILFLVMIVISGCLSFLSVPIIKLFSTLDYYSAAQYIQLLCFGVMFNCLSGYIGNLFSTNKKSKYYFYSSIYGAVVAIALNFLLIPRFGIWGACISNVGSLAVILFVRIIYSFRYVKTTGWGYYISILLLYGLSLGIYNVFGMLWGIISFILLIGLYLLLRIFTVKNVNGFK